jgi:hypothetical protein
LLIVSLFLKFVLFCVVLVIKASGENMKDAKIDRMWRIEARHVAYSVESVVNYPAFLCFF